MRGRKSYQGVLCARNEVSHARLVSRASDAHVTRPASPTSWPRRLSTSKQGLSLGHGDYCLPQEVKRSKHTHTHTHTCTRSTAQRVGGIIWPACTPKMDHKFVYVSLNIAVSLFICVHMFLTWRYAYPRLHHATHTHFLTHTFIYSRCRINIETFHTCSCPHANPPARIVTL